MSALPLKADSREGATHAPQQVMQRVSSFDQLVGEIASSRALEKQARQRSRCQNQCPFFHRRSACVTAFPKADTTAAFPRRHSAPLLPPIFRSLHPPEGLASYRRHTCKAEDNNTKHGSLGRILPARGSVGTFEKYCTS